MFRALKILLRVLLLLALGLTLLWRSLEWYAGRLDVMSRGTGSRSPAATLVKAARATPLPPPSSPPRRALLPAPDEEQRALISADVGAAFLVDRNLYATSESLTDGYGQIYPLRFPGAVSSGTVLVHDRAGSGIALFSTEYDHLPSVAPIALVGASNLRPGARVRALYPLFGTRAQPAPGAFVGLRLQGRLVLLDVALQGAPRPGGPIMDEAGRAVGIVVRRREQEEDLFVAADHILELVRKARLLGQ